MFCTGNAAFLHASSSGLVWVESCFKGLNYLHFVIHTLEAFIFQVK